MATVGALPQIVNLSLYRGDTWAQELRFLDGAGQPIDLADVTFDATCRSRRRDEPQYPMTVTVIGEPAEGRILLELDDKKELDPGRYSYDIQGTSGSVVSTWARGTLDIIRDVT